MFLPVTLLAAYDHTDLWNEQKDIPHYQEGQVACQPNMVKTENFRPDKRFMPYLDWYKAPTGTSTNKPCLILLSGGAYNSIADMDKISTWRRTFAALGIQCVVLYYRTPRPEGLPIYQSAWDDGQRAVRVVRSMAASRGIDPEKIGVIGMSAGSHLATLLATSSRTAAYEPVDATDAVSAHINVALVNAIAYGMSDGLTGPNSVRGIGATLDTIFRFDEDTCPMCMTHGGADEYSPLSSSMVWRQLREKGVRAELHTYPGKGHGAYGIDRHIEFLRKLGWLSSSAPVAPLERWADDSSRGAVKTETAADGAVALTWHRPATHTTGSVQILLEGPSAASEEVRDALVAARRYLNATGITVVTAQIRADSAVADAREAVRAVRAGAADRGLDAGYVGLMGFRADAATAVLAATTPEADCKAKWVVAISPTGLGGEVLAVTANTPPILFVHEESNPTEPAVGPVASWETQRVLYVQGAVHTLAGEGPDFISAAAVPGTGAYTYLNRVYEFLSDKKDLAAWAGEPEEKDGEGGNQDGEDDEG